jgi:hypothetical protein
MARDQVKRSSGSRALTAMEQQNASQFRLTDEQLVEVRRRRAKNDPNRIPFEEVFKRFRPPDA